MDFAKALTYPFDDDDWLPKLGIAAAVAAGGIILGVLIIPAIVMGLVMAGWQLDIIRNVRNGDPTPLPNIGDDFGGYLKKGVPLFIASIGYTAPVLLFTCLLVIAQFGLLGGAGALGENGGGAVAGLLPILTICCSCLMVLYGIAAAVIYFGGLMRFIDAPEVGTFFQIGDNIAIIRENSGLFGQAILWLIVGGFIASLLGGVIPIIGTILSVVLNYYFGGHILGQLAAKLRPATPAV